MAIITDLNCNLRETVKVQYLDGNLFSQDVYGNAIRVIVMDGDEPATLSGTVSGLAIRADGATVAITDSRLSENVATIVLPAAAYAVPGALAVTIKISDTSTITTLASFVANVYQTSTETAVDPGTIIPSITALIAEIEDVRATIPGDYSTLWASLAPPFSSGTYAVGQYVTYDGGLYKFKNAHSGSWSSSDVDAVDLGAGITKNANDISDLKSAMNGREYSELMSTFMIEASPTLGTWTYKSGISRSGTNQAGNNMCRLNYTRIYRNFVFLLDSDVYEYMIWCYTNETVSSADYSPTGRQYVTGATGIYRKTSTERIRISFRRVDGADLTNDPEDPTNDAYKIQHAMHFYRLTDENLTTENAPADAKATGERFTAVETRTGKLEESSSYIIKIPDDKEETISHGVTYSITDGVATFNGTAEGGNVYSTISGGATTIPSWAEVGKSYYIEFKKNKQDDLKVNVNLYNGQTYVRSLFSSDRSGVFTIDSLEGITGIIIRYALKNGATADSISTVRLLSAPTNMDLYEDEGSVSSATAVNLRVMQYNIGKFNNGQSISSSVGSDSYYRLFTTDNFDTILLNYKRLFGNVQPDIIGIEEYEKNLNVYVPNPEHPTKPTVVDHAVDMNTVLFDRLYPYKHDHTDSGGTPFTSKRAVKSKYDIILKSSKRLAYSYEWEGNTWTYGSPYNEEEHLDDKARQWMVMDKIDVGGKTVNVICSALPTYSGMDDPTRYPRDRLIAMRKGIIEAFIAELEDEEYAFIIGDMNSNGLGGMEGSEEEGNSILNDTLIPNGWQNVMGSYFPYEPTWQSINTGSYTAVDNIFYKNNGKIQMKNYHICTDEKPGLASDHYPVYADFLLL